MLGKNSINNKNNNIFRSRFSIITKETELKTKRGENRNVSADYKGKD